MKSSLRVKISAAFFFVAIILVLFIGLTANYFLQNKFKDYTLERIKTESTLIATQLSKGFSDQENLWDVNIVETIGIFAMERGLIIKVADNEDNVIWDASVFNNDYCAQMLTNMKMNMQMQNPRFSGGYEEKIIALQNDATTIGKLTIGYYGPYYYSNNEVKYIKGLNQLLMGTGILALILSLIAGAYIAKRLSKPIGNVIEGAKKISSGEYETKIEKESSTTEIIELTDAINSLGQGLGRQETLRKQMSSDIAHELRTPISILQSHLELMIDGIWEADKKRLENLHNESVRLGKLVDELGKIAKLESENLVLNKVKLDMNEISLDVLRTVESEFFKKKITLTYDGEEALTEVDSDKIKQVMMNLLLNALKYTDPEGTVKVSVKKASSKILVSIEDNGIGIPEENLENVFERFYRVDKSRARNSGGTGIGLAIAKVIIEAHGGKIAAESIEGQGSCFTFELPA
ncbi:MAG: HAMP domain-containing histidine kinase [Eubacteriaceae bacterium]|nr:HAMP domain-containing histidine kinase [Eubacteriaceae bacterium]